MLGLLKRIGQKIYRAFKLVWGKLNFLLGSTDDEKEQYEDRVAEVEEQLSIANELTRIVLSSSDLNEICEGFAGLLKGLISIDWAAIGLIDSSTDSVLFSQLSVKISSEWDLGEAIPLANTPIGWMLKNKQAMLEPDLSKESRFPMGSSLLRQKIRTAAYMPLFSRKEVFGGLVMGSHRPDAYKERELKILKFSTTQLAIAIENNRLFRESRDGLEREAEFIATLTHELKTPLTPIYASSELLAEELRKDLQSPQAKLAENIVLSAHTLDSKISEMLELAKVQSTSFKLQKKSLDVNTIIKEVFIKLKPVAESKEQALSLKLPLSLPMVKADDSRLKRVIMALLSNAILLTPQGGSIDLVAKDQNNELVVGVKNSGEGFSPEEQKRLFKVYHSAEADRRCPLEVRLRLAICKRLVELHGGRIWVESGEGEGSTFAFSIPLD